MFPGTDGALLLSLSQGLWTRRSLPAPPCPSRRLLQRDRHERSNEPNSGARDGPVPHLRTDFRPEHQKARAMGPGLYENSFRLKGARG